MDINSPTAPRRVTSADRRVQALELRKAGYTYAQIGTTLGISAVMAHRHVVKALSVIRDKISEQTEELRTLELQRLDNLFFVIYKRAEKGDLAAVDRCLRLMERRAKLLGLDAPTKTDVNLSSLIIDWGDHGADDND